MQNENETAIKEYYQRKESKWGYRFLLKGTKHYGYYPEGRRAGLSMAQAQRLMEREIGKNLDLKRGSNVLDAGCGEGHVAIHLTEDFGYRVSGIDLLESSIKTAEQNKKKSGMNEPTFKAMDYMQTDFPDNYFDGVYTIEALMHTSDYKKTLKEFYRILKPGGVLVNHEYALEDRMTAEEERTWRIMYERSAMLYAFKDFRKSKMKGIWENAGFEKVSVRDATKEMIPFMRRLYELAYLPFHILKFFGKEEQYVNTFAGVKSYQLRHLFQYAMVRAYKSESS